MELEDEPEFDNDFDDEDLDRHAMECMKNTFFYLPLWEGFELYDSDIAFYTFALLFRLHGFSDTECLVLRRRLVFLLSKSKWTSDTVSDVFLTWGLPFWTKYFSDNFSNFLSEF